MKWTVGMAVYDVPGGHESVRAKFTAMGLLLTHAEHVGEIIWVDNNPFDDSPLPAFAAKSRGKIRYVPMPEPKGTAAPRNRVFEEAKFDHVMCVDCHVVLKDGSLAALSRAVRGREQDLFHGLLMNEGNLVLGSHMNVQWRAEMWGTWGVAWVAPNGTYFSVVTPDDGKSLRYVTLPQDGTEQELIPGGSLGLPDMPWPGHERVLYSLGCSHPPGPFQIPGHGMGLFACRKDAWLPFHKDARGFGGEEITTGIRYRQAGRRVWGVPEVRWWHDFDRPYLGQPGLPAPYPLKRWDKVRNYVLEFASLGLDLGPLREHFAKTVGKHDFDYLLESLGFDGNKDESTGTPKEVPAAPAVNKWLEDDVPDTPPFAIKSSQTSADVSDGAKRCHATGESEAQVNRKSLERMYEDLLRTPGDIEKDLSFLRQLAATCGEGGKPGRVVELGTRHAVSATAMLAAGPTQLTTYDLRPSAEAQFLETLAPPGTFAAIVQDSTACTIPHCDMLFVDTDPHTGGRVLAELERHHGRVRSLIVLHDTVSFGEWYNTEPGVLVGVREFVKKHPEWQPVEHHKEQNGLLVLQKDAPSPRPELIRPAGQQAAPSANGHAPPQKKHWSHEDPGPGRELMTLFKSVGIEPYEQCDCKAKAAMMNMWGVEGCRHNFNTIVGWLKDGKDRWGWGAKLGAGIRAVFSGVAFKINWTDPFPSLVEEAIRRAEAKNLKVTV